MTLGPCALLLSACFAPDQVTSATIEDEATEGSADTTNPSSSTTTGADTGQATDSSSTGETSTSETTGTAGSMNSSGLLPTTSLDTDTDTDGPPPECGDGVASTGQYCYEPVGTIDNEEYVVCLGAGDANGDGYGDVLFGQEGVAVVVSLGTENGQLGPPLTVTGLAPSTCALRDFAGDGHMQLAGRATGFGLWQVSEAQSIELAVTSFVGDGSAAFVVPADFNGDGVLDVLAGTRSSESPHRVIPVISSPSLDELDPSPGSSVGTALDSLAAGDLNGDGLSDAIWVSSSRSGTAEIGAMLGTAEAIVPVSLDDIYESAPGEAITDVAVAQVAGSTAADIVFVEAGLLYVLAGDGALGFGSREQLPSSGAPTDISSAELDGTPGAELLVVYDEVPELTMFGDSADGPTLVTVRLPYAGFMVDASDGNGDGADEILIAGAGDGPVMVLRSEI
ncbi:MAG: VCBS repeat-containing protein [bacterium]|nr:VCBS repeat-containing protein [bacterium]